MIVEGRETTTEVPDGFFVSPQKINRVSSEGATMPFHDLSMCHRFRNAVETLAVGTGSVQERLKAAFTFQLACLQPEEFPKSSVTCSDQSRST